MPNQFFPMHDSRTMVENFSGIIYFVLSLVNPSIQTSLMISCTST